MLESRRALLETIALDFRAFCAPIKDISDFESKAIEYFSIENIIYSPILRRNFVYFNDYNNDAKPLIFVNEKQGSARLFADSHEIGHVAADHRDFMEYYTKQEMENEANYFARRLLGWSNKHIRYYTNKHKSPIRKILRFDRKLVQAERKKLKPYLYVIDLV